MSDAQTESTLAKATTKLSNKPMKNLAIALTFYASKFFMRMPILGTKKLKMLESFNWRYLYWRPNIFLAQTFFGAKVLCSLSDEIQRRLLYFGLWEPNLTNFIKRRLNSGDYFVDVGANIGYYTLLASKRVGSLGRVVAIEASPKIFAMLQKHLVINHSKNVRAINVAISDHEGVLRLFSGPENNLGMTSTMASRGQVLECEVPSNRLENVLLPEEIKLVRLIKIDVEGAEAPILNTIIQCIEQYRPDVEIIVEINPPEAIEHGMTVENILNKFASVGFHAYILHSDYTTAAYVGRQHAIKPKRLRQTPSELADIVFSRINADEL